MPGTRFDILSQIVTLTLGLGTYILYVTNLLIMHIAILPLCEVWIHLGGFKVIAQTGFDI